jgi:hypothetical protein
MGSFYVSSLVEAAAMSDVLQHTTMLSIALPVCLHTLTDSVPSNIERLRARRWNHPAQSLRLFDGVTAFSLLLCLFAVITHNKITGHEITDVDALMQNAVISLVCCSLTLVSVEALGPRSEPNAIQFVRAVKNVINLLSIYVVAAGLFQIIRS